MEAKTQREKLEKAYTRGIIDEAELAEALARLDREEAEKAKE